MSVTSIYFSLAIPNNNNNRVTLGKILTAVGFVAGCNAVVRAESMASLLVSSDPRWTPVMRRKHTRWEPLAEVWATVALHCIRYCLQWCVRFCDRWWVHSLEVLGKAGWTAGSSVHMPSLLSQAYKRRAEAWGTFLRSGTEGCSWLQHKPKT